MAEAPIVTLTLNPALDVSSSVDVVTPTHKLRCDRPRFEPGGGGINVARVAERLGEPACAVVPLGGSVGGRLAELLEEEAINASIVEIGGDTRQSMSIRETATGDQYRFVMPGPSLSDAELSACRAAVVAAAAESRCVVISGSLPDGVDPAVIGELVAELPDAAVIVDTSGPALTAALQSGAHMVKPSARELARVVGRPLDDEAEVEVAAKEVLAGSRIDVLIASIGAGGAIACTSDGEVRRLRAPTVKVRSAVGAGDSMVAGLAVGLQRGLDVAEATALGVAAGTATVLSPGTNLCQATDVETLLPIVGRE